MLFFNDSDFHLLTAEEYAEQIERETIVKPRHVEVPCFDPKTYRIVLRRASAFIKHRAGNKKSFLITTRYGRKLKVTGDHSVFRRGVDDLPEAIPVRRLTENDYIALPAYLPVIEKNVDEVNLGEILINQATCDADLWEFTLVSRQLDEYIAQYKDEICEILMASPRFDGSQNKWNTIGCQFRKYRKKGLFPLYVISKLQATHRFIWPEDGHLRPYTGGGGTVVPNRVEIGEDVLWLLGLYLAEGTAYSAQGTYMISIWSAECLLERASQILAEHFNVRVGKVGPSPERGPQIYVHSKVLYTFFEKVFRVTGYSREWRIPTWIMQLPLSRLKFFLEGYRQGDSTHTNYPDQRELTFNTASRGLATDLIYLLLRFGIVGSLGEYETTFREQYGEKFRFWRVTVCEVSDFNILNWDREIEQTLNATRLGDLVWAKVRSIEPVETTDYVYDFSVPGAENFIAGNGILAHNTYGPRMRLDDGRVVPNFICQALRGEIGRA
ncbi:MAG TPA: hypothetical protein EYP19_07510, partial [Desulfobacterales bacterium]|nr:hypothetical protein [Desulfobacterales bacterium]